MNPFWSKIFEELKAVPVTLMLVIGAWAILVKLQGDHVSRADLSVLEVRFTNLEKKLGGVEETLRYDHADGELHKAETELFSLNQHVEEEKAKGKEVDRIYAERIFFLTKRQEKLIRVMKSLNKGQDNEDDIL